MTATNMCSNFVGFRYSPKLILSLLLLSLYSTYIYIEREREKHEWRP